MTSRFVVYARVLLLTAAVYGGASRQPYRSSPDEGWRADHREGAACGTCIAVGESATWMGGPCCSRGRREPRAVPHRMRGPGRGWPPQTGRPTRCRPVRPAFQSLHPECRYPHPDGIGRAFARPGSGPSPRSRQWIGALRESHRRYDERWLIGRHGHRTPSQAGRTHVAGSTHWRPGRGAVEWLDRVCAARSVSMDSRRAGGGLAWAIRDLGTERRSD